MAAPAILKIDIVADATKAQNALKKTGSAAEGTGSKLKGLARAATTGLAVGAVIRFGKATVSAAIDAGKNSARLEQVFRSMGDSTGVAAKAAEDYASKLSKHIGVDDDAIMKGQTLLATFGAVSGEVGRAAGIFDRATAAGADLAAAGFGSIESNAIQLGKALQDPTKGLTALGRSGVTFTEAQKKQIAQMQKSGNLLGAQKVVLGAVEKQVKGTAAATATSTDKMNVAWGETQEKIGNALLPVLNALAPILQTVAGFIEKNTSWLLPLAIAVGILAVAWNIASVAATLFGVSMLSALLPVLLVIAAIAALIAIGVLIVKNWGTIKAAGLAVWAFMVSAWNGILNAIRSAWTWIKSNWPLLLAILTGPIGLAIFWIVNNWGKVTGALAAVWHWINATWHLLTDLLTAPFKSAWTFIHDHALQPLLDFVQGIPGKIGGYLSTIYSTITAPFRSAFNAIAGWWNSSVGRLSFNVPGWVPGIGGKGFDVPDIPTLMTGGTVMRTGLALVHAGEQFSGVGNTFGSSTNITVNITTTGLGADAPQIQRAVVRALRGHTARNGPLDIPVRQASA